METDESRLGKEVASTTMPAEEKAKFLKGNIALSLEDMKRHRKENSQRASTIKISTILFSSILTILLGLQVTEWETYFKAIAFTLGAVVTLLNALEPFFNFRALWVEHEQALARMYRLKDDVDFYLVGTRPEEIDAEKLQAFLERYKEIWNALNESYIRHRRSDGAFQT